MVRKICIFCETWESGGIESFLYNVLLHMDLSGLEIDLVVEQLKDSVFTQTLRDAGIRFTELSGSTRNMVQNLKAFQALLAQRQYQVVHLNIYQGMSLCYAELARRAEVPVRIAHSHNTALRKIAVRPLKLMLHYVFRRRYTRSATQLWACSKKQLISCFL